MYKIRLALALTLSLLSPCAFAQTPIPATASGHALEAWLTAFNSGERARIQALDKTHELIAAAAQKRPPKAAGRR